MKEGQASRTAELVCVGRAIAHARRWVPQFSDPTALTLLSAEARESVERFLAGGKPRDARERLLWTIREAQARLMALRTVAIDEAVRDSSHRQVVILGAGLDGRAWRMPELKDAVVFEVDHPDTQRAKRSRLATLTTTARELRFVAVDFTRDSLQDCLASAGHDPSLPTTWIWEGVVMYLSPEQVEATLAVIAKRSAAGSRLCVLYHSPALMLRLVGLVVGRMGEPLRSSYTPESLGALLRRHGFRVARDENPPLLAARLGPALAKRVRAVKHLRIAIADRVG